MAKTPARLVLSNLIDRFSKIPRRWYWFWLVVMAAASGLSRVTGLAGALEGACDTIVSDLRDFDPFHMAATYVSLLTECGHSIFGSCDSYTYLNPLGPLAAVFQTVGAVWADTGAAGKIIFPLTLIAGYAIAVAVMTGSWVQRNLGSIVITVIAAPLFAPVIASVLAFILQIFAILLFGLLGSTVGLIAWLIALATGSWNTIWSFVEVAENAKRMEHLQETLTSAISPPAPHAAADKQGKDN